jgi:hypothetical protein
MKGKATLKNCKVNGQGMVEFALILPVLLVILFGIMEFGRLLFIFVTTTSASREAARYGTAVGGNADDLPRFRDCAGMRAAAKKVGILSNLRDEDIFIWYDYGPGDAAYGYECEANVDVPLGSRVVVQVRTPYSPIVPMVPINLNQVEAVSARTIVKDISVGVAAAPPPPPVPNPPPFVTFEIETQSAPESSWMTVNLLLWDANGNLTTAPDPITIYFSLNGSTAEEGVDYTLSANPLVIPRGAAGATLTIQVVNDSLYEADESVVLTIANLENGRYGAPLTHTAVILNDDAAPVMSFRLASSTEAESVLNRSVEVRLNTISGLPAYAYLDLSGTAARGLDYELTSSALVEIPAGSDSVFVLLDVIDDLMDEDDETVILTLFSPINATLGANSVHTLIIRDNDEPPTVSFAVAAQKVPEAIGEAEVVIELSQPSGREIRVLFTIGGDALPVTDYNMVTTSPVIIPPGQASAEIVVNIVADTDYLERDETVVFTMGTPVNATRSTPNIHTLTITEEPTVWFETRQQSHAENAGIVPVNIRLSPPAKETVTVHFTLSGTAASGSDYTITASPIQIAAGGTLATLYVNIIDDNIYEDNETIRITLSQTVPVDVQIGSPSLHTLTILENDLPPTVSFTESSQRVIENAGSAAITARLSRLSSRDVSVPYTVSGTATQRVDYTIPPGPLVIAPGNLTGNINVTLIADDDFSEMDETVIVSMDQPTNGTIGSPSQHTLTIASPVCPSAPVNPTFGTGNESKKLSWNIQNSRLAPARLLQVNITWPSSRANLDEVKFGVDLIGESHLFPARDGVLNITTPSPLWEGDFYTATITFVFSTNLRPSDGIISVLASFENCPTITGFYGQ